MHIHVHAFVKMVSVCIIWVKMMIYSNSMFYKEELNVSDRDGAEMTSRILKQRKNFHHPPRTNRAVGQKVACKAEPDL